MIREGVIKKAPQGAIFLYIFPGHWVPKNKDITKFWLVTDLCRLNKAVEIGASMFPTPSEVMTQIDPSQKYSVVANLTSGYH